VNETAEEARSRLQGTRAALHAAVDKRCDALLERIDTTQTTKITALERELVQIDCLLEKWRADCCAMREMLAALTDADLVNQKVSLMSRMDITESLLPRTSGRHPQKLQYSICRQMHHLSCSTIANFGQVVVPRAIRASSLTLEGLPTYAIWGNPVELRLLEELTMPIRHLRSWNFPWALDPHDPSRGIFFNRRHSCYAH